MKKKIWSFIMKRTRDRSQRNNANLDINKSNSLTYLVAFSSCISVSMRKYINAKS